MDIKGIIKGNLPEGIEIADKDIEVIAKKISTDWGKEFVPKEDYNNRTLRIDELEKKVAGLSSLSADVETYKKKSEELQQKYDDDMAAKQQELEELKTATESEKELTSKKTALRKQLEAEGANPKLVDLLELKFDLDKLDLDGEKIKDWEKVAAPVKEQYKDVFGTVSKQPANVATPPAGGAKTYTMDDIKNMSPEEINKNWNQIKDDLAKKG